MLRRFFRKWLGIDEIEHKRVDDSKALWRRLNLLQQKWQDIKNEGIIGVDLGVSEAQLILIQYNKKTRGVRVIASETLEEPHYHTLIRRLRSLVHDYNGKVLVVDRPKGIADIELQVWNGLNAKDIGYDDRRGKEKISEKDGIQSKDARS